LLNGAKFRDREFSSDDANDLADQGEQLLARWQTWPPTRNHAGPLTGIRVLDCTLAAHPLARKELRNTIDSLAPGGPIVRP